MDKLTFDSGKYTVRKVEVGGVAAEFRAFEGCVYVEEPVDLKYHSMNIYVPESYYSDSCGFAFTLETAPIILVITVGGYMPGLPCIPGEDRKGAPNLALKALAHGYIVAAPGTRGRGLKDSSGKNYGNVPACITDLKAAVRYLRHFKDIPGNKDAIITNGTSAGGALSALVGAAGNHQDFEPYLKALGAADERDDIFAASCYCPITNLENADFAYEWLFKGVTECHPKLRVPDGSGGFTVVDGTEEMDSEQLGWSAELASQFPAYLNSLGLTGDDGTPLTLEPDGTGSFLEYVKSLIIDSVQAEADKGGDVLSLPWVTFYNGKVTDIDINGYVRFVTRMKNAPAFDNWRMEERATPENNVFGTEDIENLHFSTASRSRYPKEQLADEHLVKMMNPLNYIGTEGCRTAPHWRIRHGESDRDTSLAIPTILATRLKNRGFSVDYALPYGIPHSGDYDAEELFAWIDGLMG